MIYPLSQFGQDYVQYRTYHNNFVNRWLHIIATPIAMVTFITFLSFIPIIVPIGGNSFTLGDLAAALLLIYYTALNITFAAGAALIAAAISFAWQWTFEGVTRGTYVKSVVAIHAACWLMMIAGHKFFERRNRDVTMSQVWTSPLYVTVDIFDAFGLRSAEMQQWYMLVNKNVEELDKLKEARSKLI